MFKKNENKKLKNKINIKKKLKRWKIEILKEKKRKK